jgi:lysophospholipase L1-like esterase
LRKVVTALALLSAGSFAWAQTPAAPPAGLATDPCAALPAPPSDADFRAKMEEAMKLGQPAPKPTPEMIAAFEKWQTQQLKLDFSQRCRYAAQNQKLPPPGDQRLVIFGDSIAEGWSRLSPDFFKNDIIDRGISGQTTDQMLLRFRSDVLDLKPQTVHFIMATNDIAGNTGPTTLDWLEGNIISMVALAHVYKINVVLSSVLPSGQYFWRPGFDPRPDIARVNAWLRSYAVSNGLPYVDYHAALADPEGKFRSDLSHDGTHPNAKGYAIMERLLIEVLQAKARQ